MNKTRKVAKSIKRFAHLSDKPAQPKKGVSYAVEKAEQIDAKSGRKIDGDVFKKYENGVLKRQLFVPKQNVKKLVQKSLGKLKNSVKGGKTRKGGVAQAPAPVQAQAQAQAPVVVQDGTTFAQEVKMGAAFMVGAELVKGVVGAVFDKN
jgi:hypothetical protein